MPACATAPRTSKFLARRAGYGAISAAPARRRLRKACRFDNAVGVSFSALAFRDVREEAVARDELYTADEVFLTGTAAEITPVRDIDHRKVGRGEAGPITRRLQESFFSIVKGADAKHDNWLSFV